MRWPTVLFDLDGTLLDSVPLILESYRHVLAQHGLPPRTDAEVLEGLGTTLEDQFRRWVSDPAQIQALAASYIEHNLRVHDELVRPFPGVTEIVHALRERGARLGLVTSKRRRGTAHGLASLALEDTFEVLVCGDDVARPKPDPEPVRRALEGLGVDAEGAVFIGDSTHDLHSGHAAGTATIAVTWGSGTREALEAAAPIAVATNAGELRAALRI